MLISPANYVGVINSVSELQGGMPTQAAGLCVLCVLRFVNRKVTT